MTEHVYKITVTFPAEIFPEEKVDSEVIQAVSQWFRNIPEKAILSTEHHESGRTHLEGVATFDKDQRVNNLKRGIYSSMGFTQPIQRGWSPSIHRHFIVIKKSWYLPGAINYVMKEGAGDLVKRGYSDTWIQEMVVEGEKNKAVTEANDVMIVNDSNFIKCVVKFAGDHNLPLSDIRGILRKMLSTHVFSRVRNGRALVAYLEAKFNNNNGPGDSMIANWYPAADGAF